MSNRLPGIHHVTAIAADPQRNLDFYTGLLGLRLVKLTVNFDDPGSYHLYYGDELGHPGTVLTFFSWPGAPRGRRGSGQTISTAFSVPEGALAYWVERLGSRGIPLEGPISRFGDEVLLFQDPDGLSLEMVAHAGVGAGSPWQEGPVPPGQAIRGLHGVTLAEAELEPTATLLAETLGFSLVGREGNRYRYQAGVPGEGQMVDLLHLPEEPAGQIFAGTVHHVAWRVPDDRGQQAWRQRIGAAGLKVTAVQDRQYFRSIYFREPGGVLFEIATDPPGFTLDESRESLGGSLRLPPWLEPQRESIQGVLPRLRLPRRSDGR